MSSTTPFKFVSRFILVASGVLITEVVLVRLVLEGDISVFSGLAVHSLLILCLGYWTFRARGFRRDQRLPLLLTSTTATFGPAGPLGTVFLLGLTTWFARSSLPFEEWYASLFPEEDIKGSVRLLERIEPGLDRSTPDTGVSSFIDILSFGTLEQKLDLVSLIARDFRPAFAPALRMALNESSSTVRVQAASAVTAIEERFSKKNFQLNESVDRHPDQPELWLALAQFYDDYSAAGILDKERERVVRGDALNAYEKYLKLEPDDGAARVAVGKLLIGAQRYTDAVEFLFPFGESDSSPPETALLLMECLYRLKRFGELRELAKGCHAQIVESDFGIEVQETVKLWAGVPDVS